VPNVVVTGSAGFVAGHTIPALEAAGYSVIRFDIKHDARQDVCDYKAIRSKLVPGCKVLHLAAVSRFAAADEDPPEAYRTNVGGTATVLRASADAGVERAVLASTGSVYMPVWQVPITEHHPIVGNSHYGRSKALGEQMAALHDVPFVTLRYGHLYGTNKKTGGLIDNFLNRMARGAKPLLYGGWQSADFCYIQDVVQANLQALETEHTGEIFNIGSGEETAVKDVHQLLVELTGYSGEIVQEQLRAVDAPRFVFSIKKAKRLLGYNPEWSLTEGLKDLIEKERERGRL
jgi:UDP-glucose 4-epimerase